MLENIRSEIEDHEMFVQVQNDGARRPFQIRFTRATDVFSTRSMARRLVFKPTQNVYVLLFE